MPSKFSINKPFLIFVIVVVSFSTLLKLSFAKASAIQNKAFEQIAWQYSVNDVVKNGFNLEELIVSPSEPGSALIAVIALSLSKVSSQLSSLSLAIILCSSALLMLQLFLANTLFGTKTAYVFGVLNLLGVPLLLPHSVAYFTGSALNSTFPFLLLYVANKNQSTNNCALKSALLIAGTICFSLQNLFLVPVYWLSGNYSSFAQRLKHQALFTVICLSSVFVFYLAFCAIIHQSVLEQFSLLSSNLLADFNFRTLLVNLISICTDTLTQGVFLFTIKNPLSFLGYWTLLCCFVISAGHYLKSWSQLPRAHKSAVFFVLIFLSTYALSTFFLPEVLKYNFSNLRVLVYCLPVLLLLVVNALLNNFTPGKVLLVLFTFTCLYFSFSFISKFEPIQKMPHTAAGWLLVRKYGHDTQLLKQISESAGGQEKDELMIGYGWGYSAKLLKDVPSENSTKTKELFEIVQAFGANNSGKLLEGVQKAFSEGITPKLKKEHLQRFMQYKADSIQ